MNSTKKFYVVSHKDTHDNNFFAYSSIAMLGSNMAEAWHKFIKLCGKDRQHWNKLGYIAVPVTIAAKIEK